MRYRNLLLFTVLAAIWGSAFMAIKAGLGYFPPVLFAAIRFDIAGVLMLVYAVSTTDRWRPRSQREWGLVAIGAGLMIAGYHALLFIGEQWTTSAMAAVVVSLSPVLTTVFARVYLPDERLTPVGVGGIVLGLIGVVVLARPDPATFLSGSIGEFWVLGAAAAFALGSVLARRSPASLPIQTMVAWSMIGGAVVLHAASPIVGETHRGITWSVGAVAAVGYLAVVCSALGFLIYFDLLARLGPIEINLVSYVAPAFAAVTGWLVLGETVEAATVVGFAVILTGFVLVKRDAIRRERPYLG